MFCWFDILLMCLVWWIIGSKEKGEEKREGKPPWCLFGKEERKLKRENKRDFKSWGPPIFIITNVEGLWEGKQIVHVPNSKVQIYPLTFLKSFIFYNLHTLVMDKKVI